MDRENINEKVDEVVKAIRHFRLDSGYSQEFMASKLFISQNAYSKLELGQSRLYIDRMFSIAEILQLEVSVLLNGVSENKN